MGLYRPELLTSNELHLGPLNTPYQTILAGIQRRFEAKSLEEIEDMESEYYDFYDRLDELIKACIRAEIL